MSDFYEQLNAYLGDADALTDISIMVRRCYFYDFNGYPIRMWSGQGKLFTSDGEEWLGSVDQGGTDHHKTPRVQDGRDGSSASYQFSMSIPTIPGQSQLEMYDALKADQWRVFGRTVTIFLVLFKEGEGLRPDTPIVFFKQLTMQSPLFTEGMDTDGKGILIRTYNVQIIAKDGNVGRSNIPNRTYADTAQKEYARQLGLSNDKGCEFLAALANKTFLIK